MIEYTVQQIAHMESPFSDKFGIPRQSSLAPSIPSTIVFEEEYRNAEALRGLEGFSHLWIIWQFSENRDATWHPTVRPPRLGGNRRMGVFATRSPFRPNSLGLSSVRLLSVRKDPLKGPVIDVAGADLLDGTPIFDIKPYISMDCHPDAVCGFQENTRDHRLEVVFPPELLAQIPQELRNGLLEILIQDPRPAYQDDPLRIYGLSFAGFDIRFTVSDDVLTVTAVVRLLQKPPLHTPVSL